MHEACLRQAAGLFGAGVFSFFAFGGLGFRVFPCLLLEEEEQEEEKCLGCRSEAPVIVTHKGFFASLLGFYCVSITFSWPFRTRKGF